ncbi:hypothetical protein MKX01_019792 [Papaver californicum]|nr:hypothetical protein MKX01_019792 [Papaver californicum]
MTRSMTAADRGINKKRDTRRNNRVTFGTPAESIVQNSDTQILRKNYLIDAHLPKLRGMTIPYDGWVIEIEDYGEGGDYDSGKSWTIFRIPRNMYEISKSAYTPKIVSIGPFGHRGDHGRYKAMEEHKKLYLLRLLGYTGATDPRNLELDDFKGYVGAGSSSFTRRKPVGLGTLVNAMKDLEKMTRECYSEAVHMKKKNSFDVDDPIFTTRWVLCTHQRDLLMLEMSYHFISRCIFASSHSPIFNPLLPRGEKSLKVDADKKYNHMLDVFRSSFLPIPKNTVSFHSATELEEAGIKFSNKFELEVPDLLSIQFHRSTGTLNIPPLPIDDTTVPLFLNFMAYEQSDRDAEPYFTNHFMFLDRLVNTAKDIEILHNSGVINHALGSDKDVANLINKLSREIIYDADTCHLRQHMRELNMYYDKCSVQWYVPQALIVAIILLVLTLCQTFFSFYGYFNPPNSHRPSY